jgi:hypothetical protein
MRISNVFKKNKEGLSSLPVAKKLLRQQPVSTPFQNYKKIIKYQIYNSVRYKFDLTLTQLKKIGIPTTQTIKSIRALIVSDNKNYTSETQFVPFLNYRQVLRKRFSFVFKQMLIEDALRQFRIFSYFDVIFVKLSFTLSTIEAQQLIELIYLAKGSAKLVYFDGDDDLGILWPEIFPYLDLYVKKHLFFDLKRYNNVFTGKNNLTDYVASRWGVSFANCATPFTKPLSTKQHSKLFLGPNIALDSKIKKLYTKLALHLQLNKKQDIVCRVFTDPGGWKHYLRQFAISKLQTLTPQYQVLASTDWVSQKEYYQELLSSKICVSPFGYGEICWRDFEAVLCRCLLIKPDMAHLQTTPNIFIPYESYVPVKWDYSDLEEKCIYYLEHEEERERIVQRAYQILSDYYRNDSFLDNFAQLLKRVNLI